MGFDDADFDLMLREFPVKPNYRSATLYALVGNSIDAKVLEAVNRSHLEYFDRPGWLCYGYVME